MPSHSKTDRVLVLALEDGIASTVVGPLEIFQFAGVAWNLLSGAEPQPRFVAEMAGMTAAPVRCAGGTVLTPSRSLRSVRDVDLVVVGSIGIRTEGLAQKHAAAIRALRRLADRGTMIAATCMGVCLLAEAGLLDGKEATTHWAMADWFRRRYPRVELRPERLVTDAGSVLCGGGVSGALDLSLYLVEKRCGREVALECARSMLIEYGRTTQTAFTLFDFQKGHSDPRILEAQEWLQKHFEEESNLDALAARVHMSPRHFKRRFKSATGDSPLEYLQRLRIAAARRELESARASVRRIAERVGYRDANFFRRIFQRAVGMTPLDYRRRYAAGTQG